MSMPSHQRAILEHRWRPLRYRKEARDPGKTVRAGRSNLLDLAFPHDAQMSAEHLAISWDGERCRLRDLDSAGGTFLGGERVGEADVASGSWIKAGSTNLM